MIKKLILTEKQFIMLGSVIDSLISLMGLNTSKMSFDLGRCITIQQQASLLFLKLVNHKQ
nr:MAG TPA: hypothetical protein [Caudoviricetes sp.]